MRYLLIFMLAIHFGCTRKVRINYQEIETNVGTHIHTFCSGIRGRPGQAAWVDFAENSQVTAMRVVGAEVATPEPVFVIISESGEDAYCYTVRFPDGEMITDMARVDWFDEGKDAKLYTISTSEDTMRLINYIRRLYNYLVNGDRHTVIEESHDVGGDSR